MTPNLTVLLAGYGLVKRYPFAAVDGVDIEIGRGEVVGLLGESGSGKTTLAKMLLRLVDPTAGKIVLDGSDVTLVRQSALRPFRKRVQAVFQDPYGSLNPRMTVEAALGEAIRFHGIDRTVDRTVDRLLDVVELTSEVKKRYPHELSGGQRQRVCIARALSVEPELIIADEPVSSLDVSIRAQIVRLLLDMRARFGLALLVIAHDLKMVEVMCDRALVMQKGKIVEALPAVHLMTGAQHPYTRALAAAAPSIRHVPA